MKSRNLIKERLKEDYIYNLCSYKREIIRGRVSSDSIHLGQKRKKSSTFELLYSESHLYSRQSRHKGFATISSGNNIQHKGKEQLKKRSSWLVVRIHDGWKSRGIYLRKIPVSITMPDFGFFWNKRRDVVECWKIDPFDLNINYILRIEFKHIWFPSLPFSSLYGTTATLIAWQV